MSAEAGSPDRGPIGWGLVLAMIGVGSIANGIWMLIAPGNWYTDLPAGVPDTGPLNAHFVRDIGCAFLTVGAALVWAARRPRLRAPLVAVAAVFFAAHALLHIHDVARGLLESDHLLLDVPGVYLPAILLGFAAVHFIRLERNRDI